MRERTEFIAYSFYLHIHVFDKEHFEDKQKDRLNDVLLPKMKCRGEI
jgi:hypothetical protein